MKDYCFTCSVPFPPFFCHRFPSVVALFLSLMKFWRAEVTLQYIREKSIEFIRNPILSNLVSYKIGIIHYFLYHYFSPVFTKRNFQLMTRKVFVRDYSDRFPSILFNHRNELYRGYDILKKNWFLFGKDNRWFFIKSCLFYY